MVYAAIEVIVVGFVKIPFCGDMVADGIHKMTRLRFLLGDNRASRYYDVLI